MEDSLFVVNDLMVSFVGPPMLCKKFVSLEPITPQVVHVEEKESNLLLENGF